MKTIINIARTELAQLFYSPIAWFLLVAFWFQSGLEYYNSLQDILTQQDLGGINLIYLTELTSRIFAPPYGIWVNIVRNLYLYLPLLTMGLMSREISSGTIKLLYSSPISVKEIVFGKFLAMMIYNAILMLILVIIVILALFHINAADSGILLSALFGIYLLLGTYTAIGLFMSTLTSYQVVAALSTLAILGLLNYVGTIWQDIDFVRDLTYFLSISGRTDQMLWGLITTKDVIYFVSIISVFLAFSIFKLKSYQESKSGLVKASRYIGAFIITLVVGYFTSRPGVIGYWDTTARKTMTLTPNTQEILKQTGDSSIHVTSYINLLDDRYFYGQPQERNADMRRWEPYLRFKPNIDFKYVYFYDSSYDDHLYKYNPGVTIDELAERYEKSFRINLKKFKKPEEIRKEIDLRPEHNRYVMLLEYNGQKTFLRLFNDMIVFPSETEVAAALKRLMQAKLPKIAFVQGELERSIDKAGEKHYKMLTNEITFRNSLINQGFDVEAVNLKNNDIPDDISALVIADPLEPFDTIAIRKVQQFIDSGGNLLLAAEPGSQELLKPFLSMVGVRLKEGMLVQPSNDFSPDMVKTVLTKEGGSLTSALQKNAEDSLPVTMIGASALEYDQQGPFTITPLVMSPAEKSWNKYKRPSMEEIESASRRGDPEISNYGVIVEAVHPSSSDNTQVNQDQSKSIRYIPAEGDQNIALPTVVGLTRKINGKEQRIVVSGDADFLNNMELARMNMTTANFNFSTALFSWFSYSEFPIDTSRPRAKDNSLNLTKNSLDAIRVILLGIIPGILILSGAILLIRRRRK